jgi:DNA polymerase-3 subunit delta'
MTHAWLITGPPGSGRSVAAAAFAAALQCPEQGCGTCPECREVANLTHPDVLQVRTEGLSLKIEAVRKELVPFAARRPARGRWQVVLVEEAERLTDEAADALLLSVEEPPDRSVWLLCAPTTEDIPPTIRSRARVAMLRTPPAADVAQLLVGEGVAPERAAWAARAAQGHIGRARTLAVHDPSHLRREAILAIPAKLARVSDAVDAAGDLLAAAQADAADRCDPLEQRETADLALLTGTAAGARGRTRDAGTARKELEKAQKSRRTRMTRDSIDRALVDLLGWYRDVLRLQHGAGEDLINADRRDVLLARARTSSPLTTVRHLEAIMATREALDVNANPQLALERLTIALAPRGQA